MEFSTVGTREGYTRQGSSYDIKTKREPGTSFMFHSQRGLLQALSLLHANRRGRCLLCREDCIGYFCFEHWRRSRLPSTHEHVDGRRGKVLISRASSLREVRGGALLQVHLAPVHDLYCVLRWTFGLGVTFVSCELFYQRLLFRKMVPA